MLWLIITFAKDAAEVATYFTKRKITRMMLDETFSKLKRSLIKHEGRRNYPYIDYAGNMSIGIGYDLTGRGMPEHWIDSQFYDDVSFFYNALNKNYPFFCNLNADRQIILIDMAFMGLKRLDEFKLMWDALARQDFALASKEIMRSHWAIQVGQRAIDLAMAMKSGVYNV